MSNEPLTPEEMDAYERIQDRAPDDTSGAWVRGPVFFTDNGMLPPGAPSAQVLDKLASVGLIVKVTNGLGERWVASNIGRRFG
jgi:hypothetical protein